MENTLAPSRKRRVVKRLLTALAVLLALIIVVVGHDELVQEFPSFNSRLDEIDLGSGRTRTTRYLFFVPISVAIHQTAVSRVLSDAGGAEGDEQWHTTHSHMHTVLVRVRVNYRHGGAPGSIDSLSKIWQTGGFTADARRKSARQLLHVMRESKAAGLGGLYVSELIGLIQDRDPPADMLTAADIPDDLAEQVLCK
jgi:hypothetical protein